MALNTHSVSSENNDSSTISLWSKNIKLFQSKNITAKDRIFFFQQIQLLLQTGTPLRSGLSALAQQSDKAGMRRLLNTLTEAIDNGQSFSAALTRFPYVFNATHINLISAGEQGGYLDKVLKQIIDMEERRANLKDTLKSAISYPVFLAGFSFGVVIFILVVVFPKFEVLFEKIHDHLPVTTKFLMWLSDTLTNHWLLLMIGFSILMILVYFWLTSEAGRNQFDRYKLSIPIFKDVFTQIYLVQSLRVMYLSLNNGVTIVDTLSSCKAAVQNKIYENFLINVEKKVQEGSGISEGFSQVDFIPPLVKQMMATGEEAGQLPVVMGKIADYYEAELLKKLKALSKLAEPIMLVLMGALVGVIVSSLILPIFMLSRVVN